MEMIVFIEKVCFGEVIMFEGQNNIFCDNVVVVFLQIVLVNVFFVKMVVVVLVMMLQFFVGIGNGVFIFVFFVFSLKVKDGDYKVVFIEFVVNFGIFEVFDFNGKVIGIGVVGIVFNKEVKFMIVDGVIDFVVGDVFMFIVVIIDFSFEYVVFNFVGIDGFEILVGYSLYLVIIDSSIKKKIVFLSWMCELNGNCIVWFFGIMDVQKMNVIQVFVEKNIIVCY